MHLEHSIGGNEQSTMLSLGMNSEIENNRSFFWISGVLGWAFKSLSPKY